MTHPQRQDRVLVIGPGRRVRGGITAVIAGHSACRFWTDWNCTWLETYDDRGAAHKIARAGIALIRAPFAIARADIVHIHLAASVSACRKLPFAAMAALMGKPLILHFHAPSMDWLFERTPRWVLHSLMNSATVVAVLSPFWRRGFAERWPAKRLEVVPNPAPPAPASGAAGPAKIPGSILYAGKIEERKGYDLLLRAFAQAALAAPHAKLWFAGHGDLENAAAIARELKIEAGVEFLGWLSPSELRQRYLAAEIFCLPSYAEGAPMSVLEAMAYGLPVLTTPVGGIPDVVRDGENGMLVPPGQEAALAARLIELLANAELRQRLGQNARDFIAANHSVEQLESLFAGLYSSLTSRGGQAMDQEPRRECLYILGVRVHPMSKRPR